MPWLSNAINGTVPGMRSGNAEIRLLGQKIVLKTSSKDVEAVRDVIDLVQTRIGESEKRIKGGGAPHQVALLALLDLAEDYVRSRKLTEEFKIQVEEKSERLLHLIENEPR